MKNVVLLSDTSCNTDIKKHDYRKSYKQHSIILSKVVLVEARIVQKEQF